MKLHHMTGIGLSNVYLRNGFKTESSDGDETISYQKLDGLYFEISRTIASHPYTMRAEEFRFMRKQLRMSQSDIATLFDKSDQAVAKWEKGLLPVPKSESTLLKIVWLSQKVKATEFKNTVLDFKTNFQTTDQLPMYAFSFDNGVWQFDVGAAKTYPKASSTSRTHLNGASQRL